MSCRQRMREKLKRRRGRENMESTVEEKQAMRQKGDTANVEQTSIWCEDEHEDSEAEHEVQMRGRRGDERCLSIGGDQRRAEVNVLPLFVAPGWKFICRKNPSCRGESGSRRKEEQPQTVFQPELSSSWFTVELFQERRCFWDLFLLWALRSCWYFALGSSSNCVECR